MFAQPESLGSIENATFSYIKFLFELLEVLILTSPTLHMSSNRVQLTLLGLCLLEEMALELLQEERNRQLVLLGKALSLLLQSPRPSVSSSMLL